MPAALDPLSEPIAAAPRRPWYHWRRWGFNFLTISILVHLFFGVGATCLIVQTIQAKRKQTFAGPPQAVSAPQRALEHKVQLQKKQQTMSAPAPLKRITTTSNSKVALPAMPAMPKMDSAITPMAMAGMGGTGVSMSMGAGGGVGSGGGGGLTNFIGSLSPQAGLVGTFYDLKQSPDRQPTGMTVRLYADKVNQFAKGGFNESILAPYFKAPKPIYATRVFTPDIPASQGPAAFGLEKEVQPTMWVVLYKGTVIAPDSGTFRFAGQGDDILFVRFDNRFVLDACWATSAGLAGMTRKPWSWPVTNARNNGLTTGLSIDVTASQSYSMEVLIGEMPGGRSHASLLIQKEGENYAKDGDGNNLLPVFRLKDESLVPPGPGMTYAPHADGGPVWRAAPSQANSIFSH